MSSYQLQINHKAIEQASHQAFRQAARQFNDQLKEAIRSPVYQWPVDPSPRDIVDTGAFAASQQMVEEGPTGVEYSWDAPYASYVRYGYVTRGGTQMPPRPFDQVALQSMDLAEEYRRAFSL